MHIRLAFACVPTGHWVRHLVPFRYFCVIFAMVLKHDRQVSFCWWLGQVAQGKLHLKMGMRLEDTLSIR